MGKVHIFTKEQEIILDEIRQSDFFRPRFYFTGGTALSAYYLHHRYSEDLDFFSEEQLDNQVLFTLMEEWGRRHAFTFQSRFAEVVYVFDLTFTNKARLKVDFAYYPYKRIKQETNRDGFKVDSLTDIAVNKFLTISQRVDVKDFVDLYFLLDHFTIWDLMEGLRVKFRMKTEPFLVASDFLKVEDFVFLPKMIKPLRLAQLKRFFRQRAKEIGKRVTE